VTVEDGYVERRISFVIGGFQRSLLGEKVMNDD
jgi:hypothetical protein